MNDTYKHNKRRRLRSISRGPFKFVTYRAMAINHIITQQKSIVGIYFSLSGLVYNFFLRFCYDHEIDEHHVQQRSKPFFIVEEFLREEFYFFMLTKKKIK